MSRLSRITDLFVEGRELVIDDQNVIWVNKLNSFEDEEARRDGSAARAMRTLELNDNNPEIISAQRQMVKWSHEELVRTVSQQRSEEFYVMAVDDVDSVEEWRPKLEALRRSEELMADASVPEDDPKREEMAKLNEEYFTAVQEALQKRLLDEERLVDELTDEQLCTKFIESWRTRNALGEFIKEQRITQIFFALRACDAMEIDGVWDHSKCTHEQLLADRKEVRSLPEELLEKVTQVLVEMSVDRRTAGNSVAPTSSSESSGPQNPQEESTPSIPVVMPVAAR